MNDDSELWLASRADNTFKLFFGLVCLTLAVVTVKLAFEGSAVIALILGAATLACAWMYASLESLYLRIDRARGTVEVFFRNHMFYRVLPLSFVRAVRFEQLGVSGYGLRFGPGGSVAYANGDGGFIVFDLVRGGRVAVRCTNALMVPAVVEQLQAMASSHSGESQSPVR
jgi:hypothetical protein